MCNWVSPFYNWVVDMISNGYEPPTSWGEHPVMVHSSFQKLTLRSFAWLAGQSLLGGRKKKPLGQCWKVGRAYHLFPPLWNTPKMGPQNGQIEIPNPPQWRCPCRSQGPSHVPGQWGPGVNGPSPCEISQVRWVSSLESPKSLLQSQWLV